jgi:hypothetical protein
MIFINRFSIIGLFLLMFGFFTLPILIGLFIMPIGSVLLIVGVFISFWRLIPGHKILEPKIRTFKDQHIASSPILTMIFGKKEKTSDLKE